MLSAFEKKTTMKKITFYHTADVHFGVENYGTIDSATGIHTRLLDFKKSLDFCVDKAVDEDIDFFILAGDAYKTAHPTPTQQKLLMQVLLKLYKAHIPVVIIVGNHDHPLSFGKAHALDVFGNLPVEGFHVFSKPEARVLQTKSGPVQIVGIPWPMRHTLVRKDEHRFKTTQELVVYLSSRVGKIIQHLASSLDPKIPAVLASHLTVSTGIFSGSEKCAVFGSDPVFMPSQLAIKPFDYVALGHLHRYQDLNKGGSPPVVYSGSIERVDFGERKEKKGFCRVTIDEKRECTYDFIEVPMRPMIQVDVTLEPHRDQTEQLLAALKEHDIEGAILKIIYHVPEGKKDRVDLSLVHREIRAAHYVAGIVPVHTQEVRERRTPLKVEMNISELLSLYFTSKDYGENKIKDLTQKAHQLYQEACDEGVE